MRLAVRIHVRALDIQGRGVGGGGGQLKSQMIHESQGLMVVETINMKAAVDKNFKHGHATSAEPSFEVCANLAHLLPTFIMSLPETGPERFKSKALAGEGEGEELKRQQTSVNERC